MASTTKPSHLAPSELGNKAQCVTLHLEEPLPITNLHYSSWDDVYAREIANHQADPSDEGTIWFDDSGAEEKVTEFLESLELGAPDDGDAVDNPALRIADIGTGNGHLLFALRDEGWKAQLVGLDYSPASVELCRRIAAERSAGDAGEDTAPVDFHVFDILQGVPGAWASPAFDAVLDKGTFDAISLSDAAVAADGRRGCEVYAEKAAALLKPGSGYLVVTSCNWTADELTRWFDIPALTRFRTIAFPSFQFGGVEGQTVSAVCFRRRCDDE